MHAESIAGAGTRRGVVSVVVASYNHARFLPERMDSLLAQSYSRTEILVIDDCSPDDSATILHQYAAHSGIRLIERSQNGGWVEVSNQGIELTDGEFVLFANCDDACAPQMLERLVAALETHPEAGIAFCRSLMIDENSRVTGDDFALREAAFQRRCSQDTLLGRQEASLFLLESCIIPNLSAALFRRSVFNRIGVLSNRYRVCCDWDLFFRVAEHYDIAYVAEPLNHFRQHSRTIRSSTRERVVYEEYFRLLLGRIRALELSALERLRYRTHVMYLWAVHVIARPPAGIPNIPYHFMCILKLDAAALLCLPIALLRRTAEVAIKLFLGARKTGSAR